MARRSRSKTRGQRIDLTPTVEFLHHYITEALCNRVFSEIRDKERQRDWTLFALARFWIAVILDPPPSLAFLLERAREKGHPTLFPEVSATDEAFFQRCKNLSSEFFMGLHSHFVNEIIEKAPLCFARRVSYLKKRFTDVLVIDASKLDAVAHRLKILWNVRSVILPGCVTALYDIFRGFASQLWFDPDAAKSEHQLATVAIETLPEGTLLLGDRLYCTLEIIEQLEEQKCFGFFRRWKVLKITKVERIFHKKTKTEEIEDWIVEAGTGDRARYLRMIVLKKRGRVYSALTNILDPKRLSAEEAVELYPIRWQVERLFFDLKEVLNLHRFYTANPNGVAMQVYAAAIVHTAFRMAQARIAEQAKIEPEELSPQKLYPRLSMAAMTHLGAEIYFDLTRVVNPGVELRKPKWKSLPNMSTTLEAIRVEHRKGRRRKRRFCKSRRKWKSFKHVSGGKKLT